MKGQSTAGTTVSPNELTLKRLLYRLYRGRWLLGGVAGFFFLFAAYLAVSTKPRFTANASFLPPNNGSAVGSALVAQMSSLGGAGLLGGIKTNADTAATMLRSQTIAADMVRRFNLRKVYGVDKESVAEAILAANSQFAAGLKDGMVFIAVTDGSPARARDMANAYLDEIEKLTANMALTESTQRRLFYEQRMAEEKNALADAEVALKKNEESSGMIAPAGQTTDALQATAQLRAEIASREVQLAAMLQNETEANPDVIRLRKELDNLRAQVGQMENGRQGPSGGFTRAQVPGMELEYVRLQREVKYHETLFDILSRQSEAARLDEAHDSPLQVVDHAVEPDKKSGPKRSLILIFGLALGLVAGVMAVLLRDLWRHLDWNPDEEI